MNQKTIIKVLIAIVVVLVAVNIIDNQLNNGIIRKLQGERTTERKKSQKVVDSLQKIIKLDSLSLTKRVDSITKVKDKLQKDYDKLLQEQAEIESDIVEYLASSDSIRFAKFKRLITELGQD